MQIITVLPSRPDELITEAMFKHFSAEVLKLERELGHLNTGFERLQHIPVEISTAMRVKRSPTKHR
jgi:hypothetical protein